MDNNTDTVQESILGPLYVDPISDFGFKKIMSDQEILIDFLNTFMPTGTPKIIEATRQQQESLADHKENRKVIFDVIAKDENGKTYIIEVQKASQDYFIKRSMFYTFQEITEQSKHGENWQYNYLPVHSIAILNYNPSEAWATELYNRFTYKKDNTYEELTDTTSQTYILLKRLNDEDMKSRRVQWCKILRSMVKEKPENSTTWWTQDKIFERIGNILSRAALSKEDFQMISDEEKSLADYYNLKQTHINYGYKQGLAEGITEGHANGLKEGIEIGLNQGHSKGKAEGLTEGLIQGIQQVAIKLLQANSDTDFISKMTGLSNSDIEKLTKALRK